MKKLSKKLLLSILTVALTFIALGTSTFAWFSMNNSVNVSGMEVKTVVSDNLLIDDYDGGSWATNDSTFKAGLVQTINSSNVLVPVSTVNGYDFFFTAPDNVAGNGDAATNAYTSLAGATAHATNVTTLKNSYSDADDFYLDYHFILKADNTDLENAKNINLSALTLNYSIEHAGVENAWRVAVFAKKFATAAVNGAKTAPGINTSATKIYAPTGADHFESNKAVNSATTTGTVTYASSASDSTIATVAAGQTEYYEVFVRIWLEGEDKSCTVETFKTLDAGTWSLECAFILESGTTHGIYALTIDGESARA